MSQLLEYDIKVNAKALSSLSFNEAKALALVVFMRAYQQKETLHSKSYSLYDLHKITGLHYDTLKKRINALRRLDLVHYGERFDTYIFLRIRARNVSKNVNIKVEYKDTVKDVERLVLVARLQVKLQQKEYISNAFRIAKTGFGKDRRVAKLGEIKKVRKFLRDHCKVDYRFDKFTDNGWSYKSIASYLGVSIRKAIEIVSLAVMKNIIVKVKNEEKRKITSEYDSSIFDYTFILHGYMYKVYSNKYMLASNVALTVSQQLGE